MSYQKKYIIGIDASRNRSGGAKAHLIGILNESDPKIFGIKMIHVWSYPDLLNQLPEATNLVKHIFWAHNKNIIFQILWQYFFLKYEAKKCECDIMLNTDAGTFNRFKPAVTMSRDMLSYENGEINRFPYGRQRIRLFLLKYIQSFSLKGSAGVIFLTSYASSIIQKFTGKLSNYSVIPHGISNIFRRDLPSTKELDKRKISCIYVSNIALYKHQWHVIEAIYLLRKKGFDIKISFVGKTEEDSKSHFEEAINKYDPELSYINYYSEVAHKSIPSFIFNSDIFIFASSCENMPNTLVEGMSSGIPIACSNRGPMPEVLKNGGVYFNPEDSKSIANSIEQIIIDDSLRISISKKAINLSKQYSWQKCGNQTWEYLCSVLKNGINK